MTMEHDLRQAALLARSALSNARVQLVAFNGEIDHDGDTIQNAVLENIDAALSAIEAVQEKGEKGNLVHLASGDLPAASGSDVPARPTSPAEFSRDDDGELLIDWSPGPGRMLTVSLRADGRLSYALTWDGDKQHGIADMPPVQGAVPLTLEQIVAVAEATLTAELGTNGYVLPFSFARAIEAAHGISAPPVAEPGQAGKGETK